MKKRRKERWWGGGGVEWKEEFERKEKGTHAHLPMSFRDCVISKLTAGDPSEGLKDTSGRWKTEYH